MIGEKKTHTERTEFAFSRINKDVRQPNSEYWKGTALHEQAISLAAIAEALEAIVPLLEKIANPLVLIDEEGLSFADANSLRRVPLEGSIEADITQALAEGKTITMQGQGGGGGRGRYEGVEGMNEEPGQ